MALIPYGYLRFFVLLSCRIIALFYCIVMTILHQALGSFYVSKRGLGLSDPTTTVVVFATLSCLHFYGIVLMLLPVSQIETFKRDDNKSRLDSVKELYHSYLGPLGKYGRRGEDYELRLILREALEIPTQTIQAYNMSLRVPSTIFPNSYAILIALDCLLVPVIMMGGDCFLKRKQPFAKLVPANSKSSKQTSLKNINERRNKILLLDTVLDIILGAVLPILILAPQMLDFFADSSVYTDLTWTAITLSTVTHTLVTDYFDLAISATPLISSHLLMKTLHCNWADDEREAKQKPFNKPKFGRALVDKIFGTFSVLWGIALLLLLFSQNFLNDLPCQSNGLQSRVCQAMVSPWKVPLFSNNDKCHCLYVHFKCHKGSDLLKEAADAKDVVAVRNIISESLVNDFEPSSALGMTLNRCPMLGMPEGANQFTRLNTLAVVHCNQLSSFTTPIDTFTRLLMLNVGNAELPAVPEVFERLPISVFYLLLSSNRISEIPGWVGQSWQSLNYLALDRNNITTLPASLYNITSLSELYLKSNQLTEISASIGQLENLKVLELGGNKLQMLPSSIDSLSKLEHVNVGSNNISSVSSLPWSLDVITNWSSERGRLKSKNKLTLAYNPVCEDDRIIDTVACFPDCAPLCDIRERARKYCSLDCNTTACDYHDGHC